jgi:hypothetical protein
VAKDSQNCGEHLGSASVALVTGQPRVRKMAPGALGCKSQAIVTFRKSGIDALVMDDVVLTAQG